MFRIGRLLIERMEHRILVGTLAFLGIMVLTGWIAINEGGRMRAFEEQYLARSIERGASLFALNCTVCHGRDGRGLAGQAPGLNNPALFGWNPFAEIDNQINLLTAEREEEGTTPERISEIDTELASLQTQRAQLDASLQPLTQRAYDPTQPDRLVQVGWGGGLETFVYTTLVHGRPTSRFYYPAGQGSMPAWSQLANGPLRNDQLQDLTNFVLNYDKGNNWTLEDLMAVQQFAVIPGTGQGPAGEPAGTDPMAIMDEMMAMGDGDMQAVGDPVNGQALYQANGCVGCHLGGVQAPPTEGTWTRVINERLTLPEFEGYTPEQYIIESIVDPPKYLVPPYGAIMPPNFGQLLSVEQIADLVAYLRSQDQETVVTPE